MTAAEYALREVLARSEKQPETITKRYYAREQRAFTNHVEFSQFNTYTERATFPLIGHEADVAVLEKKAPMTVGATDPIKRELESMGVVASSYEPLEIRFNQFKAKVPGRYKLRLSAHSFWAGPQPGEKWFHPSRTEAYPGRTREPITLYAEIPPRQMRYLANVDVSPEPSIYSRSRSLFAERRNDSARCRAPVSLASSELAQSAGGKRRTARRRVSLA